MSSAVLSPGPLQVLWMHETPVLPKEAAGPPHAPAWQGGKRRIFLISSTRHLEALSQHLTASFQLTWRSASSPKP